MPSSPDICLQPEEELLISLCGSGLAVLPGSVTAGINWDKLVQLANEHGVLALCRHNLLRSGYGPRIPAGALATMQTGYLKSLARNTYLYDHLREIVSLAESKKIRIILLKGIALEKTVYGNIGLRQMNDIDFLVRREDAIPLRRLLLGNGFSSMPMISPLHERILPSYGKHLPELTKGGIAAEIHFRLFDRNDQLITGDFISASLPLEEGKMCMLIPEPRLHFLYLVKHLDLHERNGNSQLRLYTDLAVMISAYPGRIITRELFKYAEEAGIMEAVAEKLYVMKTFWGFEFPVYADAYYESIDTGKAVVRFLDFLKNPNDSDPVNEPESLLRPIKDLRGITDRIMFIAGYLFPSLKFMKYRYGARSKAVAILYYPVRWLKLAGMILGGKV